MGTAGQQHVELVSWEKGLYLVGIVNKLSASFLVDTGAGVSIISLQFYERLQEEDWPVLQPTSTVVKAVQGSQLSVAGVGNFNLQFGEVSISRQILVADIPLEAILG